MIDMLRQVSKLIKICILEGVFSYQFCDGSIKYEDEK